MTEVVSKNDDDYNKSNNLTNNCFDPKLYKAAIIILFITILFIVYYIFFRKKSPSIINSFGTNSGFGNKFG